MRFIYNHTPIEFYFAHSPRDFVVQEIPLYKFSGSGEHQILQIRKKHLTTFDLIKLLSKHFNIHPKDIGYAGLKDKSATTTQFISLPKKSTHSLESRFDTLEREHNIKLLSVTLHNNKLRLGHLKGNRFFIRLKKVGQAQASKLESVLGIVGKNGFPNFFGFQRFGIYGDNYKLGWAHHNATKAVHKHSVPNDTSYAALFSTYMNQNKPKIPKIQRTMRDFLIASYQSFLFNAWLEARVHLSVWVNTFSPAEMKEILAHKLYHNSPKQAQQQPWQDFLDSEYSQNFISTLLAHNIKENLTSLYGQTQIFKLLSGDLCCHYPYGKLFMLESINAYESERFAQRGFAPTGLLSGKHQKISMGSALALECAFLENLNASSARRYAWVWADDIQSVYKPQDAHFELNFSLPKGAYATTFLEQLARKKLHYTIAKEELV